MSGAEGTYLRYDIKRGNDALIAMHDRLYTGPRTTVTVGRVISYRRYADGTRHMDPTIALRPAQGAR